MNDVTIKVSNVKCKVVGLPPPLVNLLANHLTVKVPNFYFSAAYKNGFWDGTQKFFTRPANTFPTGLLPKVVDFLQTADETLTINLEDNRTNGIYKIPKIEAGYELSSGKTLRDYQVDTINTLAQNKVLGIPFYRGVVNIATNGGKTVIAEGIMNELHDPLKRNRDVLLFVTHSKEIARQTQKSIERDLNITVGFVGDGEWNVRPITIAIITTLYRRCKDGKPEFEALKDKVAAVIGDEIHHLPAQSWQEVLNRFDNASIRIGLTGTVDKSNPVNEMKLYSCSGPIIKKISNDYLIEKGVSAKPICLMFKISQPDINDFEYQDAYTYGIVENEFRHDIIYDICDKETRDGNKVLILVERIEHGENLAENLKPLNKEVYFTNGQISSSNRESYLEMLKKGQLDILIASNILDEGVDVSGINAVIYARGMKSMRKLLQGIGRGLRMKADRSNLRFYDFIDDTNLKLLLHSKERYETLAKEKFLVKLMDQDNYMKMSWEKIMEE